MINDFIYIFSWWLLFFSIGLISLPLTFIFFEKFFDHGYALAKIIGILIISYLSWLLVILKILPFANWSLWLIVSLFFCLNLFLIKKTTFIKKSFKQIIKNNWRVFLLEEIIFFFCLTIWSFVRGFQPEIHGLEKFMDYGFVNSILRSFSFPPIDMWLSGNNINYYYFGHLVTAVLIKISSIPSSIAYNLMIASLFALSFSASFSLGANLIRANKKIKNKRVFILGGFLTAFLLTLGGNLHPLWYWLTHKLSFLGYWYPDATRFIVELFGAADNTIHEFPLYSFVVADLHGHLLNLPFVLLFLSLVFSFLIKKKLSAINIVLPSLLLGIFYLTNAWDLPIYFLLLGLTVFWINYLNHGYDWQTIKKTFFFMVGVLALAIIFTLPFHFNFKSMASGLSLVDFHSPGWMLLVLWGFPLIITLSWFLFLRKFKKEKLLNSDYFILIMLLVSWLLIIIPEVFYLKDIYIHSYQRANTMFKFTYQSFAMFSLAEGYIIINILANYKKTILKFLSLIIILFLIIFVFLYPYFAIRSFYGFQKYQGLDGLTYLEKLYPDDYQGILWLRKQIPGQPVILEAVGESYTDFTRVSANTGLPTVLGWRVHEWLWRGSFDEASKRTEEVKEIYEGKDINNIKNLLRKYQIKFIFVGNMERQAYPQLEEEQLLKLGKIVFSSNQTRIYQLDF